jgi:hypothetical protein
MMQQSIRGAAAVDAVALFASMLELEQSPAHRPAYNPEARYVRVRRLLVDWISELGEDYSLANTTVHAAVELLDRFLQSMDVHRTRYQLVAMACFLIAGASRARRRVAAAVDGICVAALPNGVAEVAAARYISADGRRSSKDLPPPV